MTDPKLEGLLRVRVFGGLLLLKLRHLLPSPESDIGSLCLGPPCTRQSQPAAFRAMQAMHASSRPTTGCAAPFSMLPSVRLPFSHTSRADNQQTKRSFQGPAERRDTRICTACKAAPLPAFELAADASYWLQLASFAVLGGFVIYFTLNYIGLNVTLNKVCIKRSC